MEAISPTTNQSSSNSFMPIFEISKMLLRGFSINQILESGFGRIQIDEAKRILSYAQVVFKNREAKLKI